MYGNGSDGEVGSHEAGGGEEEIKDKSKARMKSSKR